MSPGRAGWATVHFWSVISDKIRIASFPPVHRQSVSDIVRSESYNCVQWTYSLPCPYSVQMHGRVHSGPIFETFGRRHMDDNWTSRNRPRVPSGFGHRYLTKREIITIAVFNYDPWTKRWKMAGKNAFWEFERKNKTKNKHIVFWWKRLIFTFIVLPHNKYISKNIFFFI